MRKEYKIGATSNIEIRNYFYSEDIFCVTPLMGTTNIWWERDWSYSPTTFTPFNMQYSFDKITWNNITVKYTYGDDIPGTIITTDKPVYFRGINTAGDVWCDNYTEPKALIVFRADNLIALSGKLSSLVDYTSNTKLDLPRMMRPFQGGSYFGTGIIHNYIHSISHLILDCDVVRSPNIIGQNCYQYFFAECENLIDTPIYDLSPFRYSDRTNFDRYAYAGMFEWCEKLRYVTSYPPYYSAFCYEYMFAGCKSLETVPALPTIETAHAGSFKRMFEDCINLRVLPKLTATTILDEAYAHMFSGCKKIMLSATQTGAYNTPYRIPVSGEAQATSINSYYNMFAQTGGTFTTPLELNTTYYTSNTVI